MKSELIKHVTHLYLNSEGFNRHINACLTHHDREEVKSQAIEYLLNRINQGTIVDIKHLNILFALKLRYLGMSALNERMLNTSMSDSSLAATYKSGLDLTETKAKVVSDLLDLLDEETKQQVQDFISNGLSGSNEKKGSKYKRNRQKYYRLVKKIRRIISNEELLDLIKEIDNCKRINE